MLEQPEQVVEQFDDMAQEHETANFGMWVFLVTEFLFFSVLFAGYALMRTLHPEAFNIGAAHNDLVLGIVETSVLITSSLTMTLAVHSAQHGQRRRIVLFLVLTMLLGGGFIAIHFIEYYHHYMDQLAPGINFGYTGPHAKSVELFFYLYFVTTGFHMLHLTIGVIELGFIGWFAWQGKFSERYYTPVENSGLYWHFVDIVWIFLFPFFYLVSNR